MSYNTAIIVYFYGLGMVVLAVMTMMVVMVVAMIRTSDDHGNDGQGEDDQDSADDEKRCVDKRQTFQQCSVVDSLIDLSC